MKFSEIIKIEWWKENIEGFIIGILAGIIATLIVMIIVKVINSIFLQFVKPKIEINFTENENELVIELENKGKNKVGKLFFKIDIPGKFVSYEKEKNFISTISLNNEELSAYGEHLIVTAETLKIELSEMMPEGWCRIKIRYKPTNKNEKLDPLPPYLDLHAVIKIYYFWEYLGKEQYSNKYIELFALDYIKQNMKNMVDFLNTFNSPNPYKELKEVKKMNWKRKDW